MNEITVSFNLEDEASREKVYNLIRVRGGFQPVIFNKPVPGAAAVDAMAPKAPLQAPQAPQFQAPQFQAPQAPQVPAAPVTGLQFQPPPAAPQQFQAPQAPALNMATPPAAVPQQFGQVGGAPGQCPLVDAKTCTEYVMASYQELGARGPLLQQCLERVGAKNINEVTPPNYQKLWEVIEHVKAGNNP